MNRCLLPAALGVLVLSAIAPAVHAADESQVRIVGDFVIHMGLIPGEMILGHRLAPEMHGGVPAGEHVYHVLIAVFDRKTGERVKDLRARLAREHAKPEAVQVHRMRHARVIVAQQPGFHRVARNDDRSLGQVVDAIVDAPPAFCEAEPQRSLVRPADAKRWQP